MRIVASVWALKSLTVGPAVRRAWNSAGPAEARGQMFPALDSRNRPLSLNRRGACLWEDGYISLLLNGTSKPLAQLLRMKRV